MIDFERIIKQTDFYNFHSHTQFCDGRDTMEDIVKAAIDKGFTHLGFSPHSPVPLKSPCNILQADVENYYAELERLKNVYGDKITLYRSFEVDYLNDWGATSDYFKNQNLDYTLSSVHFIPSFVNPDEFIDVDGSPDRFKEKMHECFYDDIDGVVISFYTQTLKMIEAGGFDIIGHFDKIGFNASKFRPGIEDEKWYTDMVREVFDAIMDYHYWIEINTKAYLNSKRFFPNKRFWNWLIKYDAPVLFSSDVHFAELVNAGRKEAISAYRKLMAGA